MDHRFWSGKRVLITGHTGFKGSWLSLWLHSLGAKITGYALQPPTEPSLFSLCRIDRRIESIIGDVRDYEALVKAMQAARPEIVFHLAAQPLVRESYRTPVDTYATNVMGTVNVLESVRHCPGVRALVVVTSDKCYENREWVWGYREGEPMGGHDPYSSSKGCAEIVTSAYRSSYFPPGEYARHGVAVASARAGNVIGGGDWAADRLIPDCLNAVMKGERILIRNPVAIRPWQHVFEPLGGYLLLAGKLYESGPVFGGGWNFGPEDSDARPVEWIVRELCRRWGHKPGYVIDGGEHPHEARYLKLDCSKARMALNWAPRWNLDAALDRIVEWTRVYYRGGDLEDISSRHLREFIEAAPLESMPTVEVKYA